MIEGASTAAGYRAMTTAMRGFGDNFYLQINHPGASSTPAQAVKT
jgi:2,4-dienoyl-CoA reductase-like NADH-dependent reductase (Old Yellow Enzyme family)